jgi:hypothetical protein
MPIIAIAIVIAAALGGGTAFAAQSSLPGDALWNFKTSVNENVEGAFAQNTKAKADLDLKLATKRLDEAQQLATDGSLNSQARADLEANFDLHAKDLATLIAKLQTDGHASDAASIAAHFQAQLAKHASDIRASATSTASSEVEPLLKSLRATLDDAATLSAETSSDAEVSGKGDSASSSDEASTRVKVQTGTSVRGGQGGIQTTEDGHAIGI